MALTASERQRRSRAHKRGDHTLCDPDHCDAVTCDVTGVTQSVVTDPILAELGSRGRRLYEQVIEEHEQLGPRQRIVLEEAARVSDRLNTLDRVLRGDVDVWLHIQVPDFGPAVLVVDKVLAEARQQQMALARLMTELRQSLTATPAAAKPAASEASAQPSGGGKIADLTSRIAERRNAASR